MGALGAIVGSILGILGVSWASFWEHLDFLGSILGVLRLLGSLLGCPGLHFGSPERLGVPLGAPVPSLDRPMGNFGSILSRPGVHFERFWHPKGAQKAPKMECKIYKKNNQILNGFSDAFWTQNGAQKAAKINKKSFKNISDFRSTFL